MIGIYKITSPSGKIYIGSSINIELRFTNYRTETCKNQVKIYNSIKKYGYDAHKFEIVEECELELLHERERYYGELYDVLSKNGLNLVLPAIGSKPHLVSEETRARLSEACKGEKNGFYGKKHGEESLKLMSKVHKGFKHTEESKRLVSINNARSNSKLVLDTNTGVYYNSCIEAAMYNNINPGTLRAKLIGRNPNDTGLIYC